MENQPKIQPLVQTQSDTNDLMIGSGVRFTGTIKVPNRALINGIFDGEIEARELLVEPNGSVSGKTTSQNLNIKGLLNADVICHQLLSIGSTGSFKGQVEYGEITIDRGGKFEGTMKQK